MVSIGRDNENGLIDESFEAWAYGPVIPELYQKVKVFGSGPIKDIFRSFNEPPLGGLEEGILNDAFSSLSKLPAGKLVDITHRRGGAWCTAYVPNANIRITNESIKEEFKMVVPA